VSYIVVCCIFFTHQSYKHYSIDALVGSLNASLRLYV
jgi:hypothetical protein